MFCYLLPCGCIVTAGSITLLLRKETAVDVHRVFIVTSVITVRQAERNEEQRVKEIYTHIQTYTYCSPTTPLWKSYLKLVRFGFTTAMLIQLTFSGMLSCVDSLRGYYGARNTSICSH